MGRPKTRLNRIAEYVPDLRNHFNPLVLLFINVAVKITCAISFLLFICSATAPAETQAILAVAFTTTFLVGIMIDKRHLFR